MADLILVRLIDIVQKLPEPDRIFEIGGFRPTFLQGAQPKATLTGMVFQWNDSWKPEQEREVHLHHGYNTSKVKLTLVSTKDMYEVEHGRQFLTRDEAEDEARRTMIDIFHDGMVLARRKAIVWRMDGCVRITTEVEAEFSNAGV